MRLCKLISVRSPHAALTACFAAVIVLVLGARTLRADDPAAKPCPTEELAKAKAALQQAQDKIAALDAHKPPANKLTKNYEDDKRAADDDVRTAERMVKDAEANLKNATKALGDLETAKGAKFAGQTLSELDAARQKNYEQMTEKRKKLDEAVAMRGKFANDSQIADQAKQMGPEKQDLANQMAQSMELDKKDQVLAQVDDPNQRNAKPTSNSAAATTPTPINGCW